MRASQCRVRETRYATSGNAYNINAANTTHIYVGSLMQERSIYTPTHMYVMVMYMLFLWMRCRVFKYSPRPSRGPQAATGRRRRRRSEARFRTIYIYIVFMNFHINIYGFKCHLASYMMPTLRAFAAHWTFHTHIKH